MVVRSGPTAVFRFAPIAAVLQARFKVQPK